MTLTELAPVDLVRTGCAAARQDGARPGNGSGFTDLEHALASAVGLIAPAALALTTVPDLQARPAGTHPEPRLMTSPPDLPSPPNASSTAANAPAPARPAASAGQN